MTKTCTIYFTYSGTTHTLGKDIPRTKKALTNTLNVGNLSSYNPRVMASSLWKSVQSDLDAEMFRRFQKGEMPIRIEASFFGEGAALYFG